MLLGRWKQFFDYANRESELSNMSKEISLSQLCVLQLKGVAKKKLFF